MGEISGPKQKLAKGNIHDVRYGQCDPPVSGSDTTGNIHDATDGQCEPVDGSDMTVTLMTSETVNVN